MSTAYLLRLQSLKATPNTQPVDSDVQQQCVSMVYSLSTSKDCKTAYSAHPVNSDSPVTVSQWCTPYPPPKTTHSAHSVNSDSPVTVSQWCTPYPSLKTTHSAHPVTVILVQSQCLNSVLCIHLSRLRTVLTLSTVTVQSQRLNVLFIHL